jgi:thioredoxin 1
MLSIANESDLKVNHGLYAIKFWATWCMPCKTYAPTIDKLDKEFEDISFISIDVDQVPTLAQKFKVQSLPALILIKDGEEFDRIRGMSAITPLRTKLRELNKSQDEQGEEEYVVHQKSS